MPSSDSNFRTLNASAAAVAPRDAHLPGAVSGGLRAFRTAVLRGLGVVAPPLLTLVILLWIVRTLDYYVLDPIVVGTRNLIAAQISDVQPAVPGGVPSAGDPTVVVAEGKSY